MYEVVWAHGYKDGAGENTSRTQNIHRVCILHHAFDVKLQKIWPTLIKSELQDYFAESSTAFLNAPSNAVNWIFSLAPVDSLCLLFRALQPSYPRLVVDNKTYSVVAR